MFQLRLYNHPLFTWPILAAALFLTTKVDSWNLFRNVGPSGVPLKTALALGLTGVTGTFLAIYCRAHRSAVLGVHLGWVWTLAAIALGYWHEAVEPNWTRPFLIMGLLWQGLYWLYRLGLEAPCPWVKALLTGPTRGVLMAGSGVLAVACMASLLVGEQPQYICWLYWFVTAQLVWHGLAARNQLFGVLLFFLTWVGLLAATAPGEGLLWARLSLEHSLSPTLWLLLCVQLIFIVLEIERASGLAQEARRRTEREAEESGLLASAATPL